MSNSIENLSSELSGLKKEEQNIFNRRKDVLETRNQYDCGAENPINQTLTYLKFQREKVQRQKDKIQKQIDEIEDKIAKEKDLLKDEKKGSLETERH